MTSYNQEGGRCGGNGTVREGNWFEELALLSATGVRFYPPPQEKSSSLLTKYRVIEHTDQVLAKDYKSTANVTLSNPQTHPQFVTLKDKPLGPRGLRLEERIKAQVDSEFSQKQYEVFQGTRHVAYQTTTSDAHDIPGFKPYL